MKARIRKARLFSLGFSIGVLAFLALCCPAANAQQQPTPPRTEADEALRQKAFELLESLAGQIGVMQSPENRARVGSNIANSLWEHDEKRARVLLLSVQEDINEGLRRKEDDPQANRERRMVFLQLRINTVERIAKYDGELALAFFNATELPPPQDDQTADRDQTTDRYDYRDGEERALEIRLARQIAVNNPDVALKLARKSLAKGFTNDLIGLLRQLTRKNQDQALALYGEMIAKLKHVDLSQDFAAFYFAQSLARNFTPPANSNAQFRELIGIFIDAAAAHGCNKKLGEDDEREYFCERLGALLPLINKVDPARGASLKQWKSGENGFYDDERYQDLNETYQDGSVDDILALGTKYPQMQNDIYLRAFFKAQMSGDIERARKLAEEFPEPERRQALLAQIVRQEQAVTKFRESLKDIQTTLDGLQGTEPKVSFLLQAAATIAPTDRKEAVKLLDRANDLVDKMKPASDQLGLQFGLSLAYCSYNDSRGIVMMESVVPRLNELIGAAAKLDGYETHHLRDGEWDMSNQGILGALLTMLSQNASYFAWCDFDRAVSVAGQFERPEVRVMAQLKLAQGILAGRPKPLPVNVAPRWDY